MEKQDKNEGEIWGYQQSFTVAGILLILGVALEIISNGSGVGRIGSPANIYLFIGFAGFLAYTYFFFRQSPVVRWLMSVPAAISAITLFTFLVLILGFVPQHAGFSEILHKIGFTHMKSSYPLLLAQVYFLLTLGMATLKRSHPFNKKNIGFLLNHFGLWLVIAAATLGSGDLYRLTIKLQEGAEFKNMAVDKTMKLYRLPFQLKLHDFAIDQYNPKLALFDRRTGQLIDDSENLPLAEPGMEVDLKGMKIRVDTLYSGAFLFDSVYIPYDTIGASPVAHVTVINNRNQKISGWIAAGSQRVRFRELPLSNTLALALTNPQPRVYSSVIEVKTDEIHDTITLEVNKPYKVKGYKIYQTGYDEQMGKWSQTSILEAVHDPWLPVVYFGIFLLLAGAVYIFWIGKDIR